MAPPSIKDKGKKAPSKRNDELWREAYKTMKDDPRGKKLLKKFGDIVREDQKLQGRPVRKLRSEEGGKQMLALINQRSLEFQRKKTSDDVGKVCDLMMNVQDIVAAGAAAASPFATMVVSGLFMAFSMNQIYRSEQKAMFDTARAIANIMIRHNNSQETVKTQKTDNDGMRDVRNMLRSNYVILYGSVLEALAKLIVALHSDWKVVRQLFRWDDWSSEHGGLEKLDRECNEYRNEIHRRKDDSSAANFTQNAGFGIAGRNPLHQAAALNLPGKVFDLITAGQYDVNALTKRKWTALSLAAQMGYDEVTRILLAFRGIKLDLQNDEGRTALHIAAARNHVAVVKQLLGQKAKMDIRDGRAKTAFNLAVMAGHTEAVKALKEKGQKLEELTLGGWTALHLAAERNRVAMVKYLLENGLEKEAKVRSGRMAGCTAKEVAEKNECKKVLKFL